MFDFSASERAERLRCVNVGVRICDAIRVLPVRNAGTMAKAAYAVVQEMSREDGQDPSYETFIKTPAESEDYLGGTPNVWKVCWESGPYQWAYAVSMAISHEFGLCEPYYSFDLTFYPQEEYL